MEEKNRIKLQLEEKTDNAFDFLHDRIVKWLDEEIKNYISCSRSDNILMNLMIVNMINLYNLRFYIL